MRCADCCSCSRASFDEALQYADSEEDKQTVRLAAGRGAVRQQAVPASRHSCTLETNKQFEEIALKFVQIGGDGLPGQKSNQPTTAPAGSNSPPWPPSHGLNITAGSWRHSSY